MRHTMARSKIAVTVDEELLRQVDASSPRASFLTAAANGHHQPAAASRLSTDLASSPRHVGPGSLGKIAQVRTLATQRLGKRIGQLPAEALREIVDGLSELIG
jgi:mRNA-degrading endonuclease toxin of MazEF toxin-antitoxin module